MTDKEYEKLYKKLYEYVRENVNHHRFKHTQGVVKAAEKYAVKYGADVRKAKIAAVFHDACKNDVGGLEHGEAAAKLLKEKFGVDDPEILAAIANHTIGRPDLCLLEKVIKLADLLEEGRDYDDVPKIREFEENTNDIDAVYLLLLERQRDVLIKRGVDYDKRTDILIDWFKERLTNRSMTNKEIAYLAATLLDKKKARDITIIDIGEKSGFADYFVIATAGNLRQLSSLANNLEDGLAEESIIVHHIEGKGDSGWILMDYGDIIVNLFTEEQRDHYNIEKIWSDCIRLEFTPETV